MVQDHDQSNTGKGSVRREHAASLLDGQLPPCMYTASVENGRFKELAVGDGVCELLGYPCEELESDTLLWTSMVHPHDMNRATAAVERLLRGEPLFEVYRVFRRDGQMRWVRHVAVPYINAGQEVSKIVGIIANASVSEAMVDNLLHYRVLLEDIPMAVMIRDLNGRVIYSNKAAADAHGFESREEMMGTDFSDVVAPESYEAFVAEALPAILNGHWSGETKLRRKDGSSFYVRAAASLIRDAQGTPLAIYGVLFDISEEKRNEEAYAATLALLQQFVENMPAAVAMFDRDMRYLVVSKRWLAEYRLNEESILGRSHYDVFPEIPDRWRRVHRNVLAGQTEACDEDSFIRVDGREEWLRWKLRPWRQPDGEIGGLIMYTEVITERKQTERALQDSRQLLATVQNSLPAEIAVLNRAGDIIAVNEGWERFARENGDPGLSHTGVGANYLEVCRKSAGAGNSDAAKALDGLIAVLLGLSNTFEMEYELPANNGLLWFTLRASPLLSESGGLVISHTDITQRKRTEQELQASEEKYRTLVESMDAFVFRADPGLRPLMILGRVEKITGRTAEELVSNPAEWFNKVVAEDRGRVQESLERIRLSRKAGSFEMRVFHRNGEVRWLRANVTPQFNAQGELEYYDGIDLDVTEQMEAAQRAERHRARVDALARINQETAGSLDRSHILSTVLESVSQFLRCVCAVLTVDPPTGRLQVTSYSGDGVKELRQVSSFLDRIRYRVPQQVDLNSVPPVEEFIPTELREEAAGFLGTSVVRQIFIEGSPSGFIVGVRSRDSDAFDEDDSWFFEELASSLSSWLTNAALYRRQTRIAETLQRSLVPSVDEVRSLDIATCYLPAVGEAEIGGDFYDVLEFGESRIGIIVGDVSGKGMEAAIHTAEAKYMLRGYALQNPHPEYVMRSLNSALCNYTGEFTFVTLVYLLIDTASHRVSYVNAGHEPPLVLSSRTGLVEAYMPGGPALGIVEDFSYSSETAAFETGDLLICYTDGVTDVPRDRDRFGYDRLVQTVADAAARTPQELLERVLYTVREFGSGVQPDDQVIVVATPVA